jgi:signal transduction histidine kinase
MSTARTRAVGLSAYLAIVALVVGGLGWVTAAALRLELSDQMRLALWRLDSRIAPALAREDSRPFQHYHPLFFPLPVLDRSIQVMSVGAVLEPSPLLNAELPDWMVLHFWTTSDGAWQSPQVISKPLADALRQAGAIVGLGNVTPQRGELLTALGRQPFPTDALNRLPDPGQPVDVPELVQNIEQQLAQSKQAAPPGIFQQRDNNDLGNRARQQVVTKNEGKGVYANNSFNFNPVPFGEVIPWGELGGKVGPPDPAACATVRLGSLAPVWLRTDGQTDRLVLARLAQSNGRKVIQGVLLDWDKLQAILKAEVADLFPDARLVPLPDGPQEHPERVMTALPVQLDPGPLTASVLPGWTPLRTGLLLAWAAALLALLVVGLGGWSLLDLSERRFRFVSAVTHELRTPLTTLRLYLDMLTSGLVRGEQQKAEYLHTLHGESDRLYRLVSNVLDFARLERQRPKLALRPVNVGDLLDQVRDNWQGRCTACGKELNVEVAPGCCPELTTDPELIQQVVGNLIDNACKYSRGAADGRVWLRAGRDGQYVVLDVEDRGPGVAPRDQRLIFRAFRRGRQADVTAGGVGLGLALAGRWARLLGGRLTVGPGRDGVGACFRLRLRAPR